MFKPELVSGRVARIGKDAKQALLRRIDVIFPNPFSKFQNLLAGSVAVHMKMRTFEKFGVDFFP